MINYRLPITQNRPVLKIEVKLREAATASTSVVELWFKLNQPIVTRNLNDDPALQLTAISLFFSF